MIEISAPLCDFNRRISLKKLISCPSLKSFSLLPPLRRIDRSKDFCHLHYELYELLCIGLLRVSHRMVALWLSCLHPSKVSNPSTGIAARTSLSGTSLLFCGLPTVLDLWNGLTLLENTFSGALEWYSFHFQSSCCRCYLQVAILSSWLEQHLDMAGLCIIYIYIYIYIFSLSPFWRCSNKNASHICYRWCHFCRLCKIFSPDIVQSATLSIAKYSTGPQKVYVM